MPTKSKATEPATTEKTTRRPRTARETTAPGVATKAEVAKPPTITVRRERKPKTVQKTVSTWPSDVPTCDTCGALMTWDDQAKQWKAVNGHTKCTAGRGHTPKLAAKAA